MTKALEAKRKRAMKAAKKVLTIPEKEGVLADAILKYADFKSALEKSRRVRSSPRRRGE